MAVTESQLDTHEVPDVLGNPLRTMTIVEALGRPSTCHVAELVITTDGFHDVGEFLETVEIAEAVDG